MISEYKYVNQKEKCIDDSIRIQN